MDTNILIYKKNFWILSVVFLNFLTFSMLSLFTKSDFVTVEFFEISAVTIPQIILVSFMVAFVFTGIINAFVMVYTHYKIKNEPMPLGIILSIVFLLILYMILGIVMLIPNFIYTIYRITVLNKSQKPSINIASIIEKRKNEIKLYVKRFKVINFYKVLLFVSFNFFVYCIAFRVSVILIVFLLILILVTYLTYKKMLNNISDVLSKIYLDYCDPELLLGVLHKVKGTFIYQKRMKDFKFFEFISYCGMGMLDEVINDYTLAPSVMTYNLLYSNYLRKSDLTNMKEVFKKLIELNEEKNENYNRILNFMNAGIALLEKDFTKSRELFKSLVKNSENMVQKVIYSYYLLQIDKEHGNNELITDGELFIRENAKTMWCNTNLNL